MISQSPFQPPLQLYCSLPVMEKHIEVAAIDIAHGERNVNSTCPIARAVKRAFGLDGVSVGRMRVRLEWHGGIMYEAELPKHAAQFTLDFDDMTALFSSRNRGLRDGNPANAKPFSMDLTFRRVDDPAQLLIA